MDDLLYLAAETGLTTLEVCRYLEISPTTWRRWLKRGAPGWAVRLLRLRAGYLDDLGWARWQIRRGKLYCDDLSWRYSWTPGELIAGLIQHEPSRRHCPKPSIGERWSAKTG